MEKKSYIWVQSTSSKSFLICTAWVKEIIISVCTSESMNIPRCSLGISHTHTHKHKYIAYDIYMWYLLLQTYLECNFLQDFLPKIPVIFDVSINIFGDVLQESSIRSCWAFYRGDTINIKQLFTICWILLEWLALPALFFLSAHKNWQQQMKL